MVKFYEAVLLIVAGLVLLKGRGLSSSNSSVSFSSSFTSLLDTAQSEALKKGTSNIETLENARLLNRDIANKILTYEKGLSDVAISDIQNELTKVQQYLGGAAKVKPGSYSGYDLKLSGWNAADLVSKFDSMYKYYLQGGADSGNQSPLFYGGIPTIQKSRIFPDIDLTLSPSVRAGFLQQAEYEQAQRGIKPAQDLIIKQQNEIERLQAEYERNYGVLSRYG